jgi:hypothetical protein
MAFGIADRSVDSHILSGMRGEWLTLVRHTGGNLFDANVTRYLLDERAAQRGMPFYIDKVLKHGVSPAPALGPPKASPAADLRWRSSARAIGDVQPDPQPGVRRPTAARGADAPQPRGGGAGCGRGREGHASPRSLLAVLQVHDVEAIDPRPRGRGLPVAPGPVRLALTPGDDSEVQDRPRSHGSGRANWLAHANIQLGHLSSRGNDGAF